VIPSRLVVAPFEAKLIGTAPPIVPALVGVKVTDIAELFEMFAARLVIVPPLVPFSEIFVALPTELSPIVPLFVVVEPVANVSKLPSRTDTMLPAVTVEWRLGTRGWFLSPISRSKRYRSLGRKAPGG